MEKPLEVVIDKFFGGMVRDDKSTIQGAFLNGEEIDIFSNKDYIQAEQIFSTDTLPANTIGYARTIGDDDTAYIYGLNNSSNKMVLLSMASGSASAPGSFTTLFTTTDTTNLPTVVGDFEFFISAESSNPKSLYYIRGTSGSWYLLRYNLGGGNEQVWNGSAWVNSSSPGSPTQLLGLNGTSMRPTMSIVDGTLYICNGKYISSVASDSAASFTQKAFTMPTDQEAVDIVGVGDAGIILARNAVHSMNESRGYWWGLTLPTGFEDMFTIPMGGPQWVLNFKESIVIFCAINGVAKFFRLSFAAKGAIPLELPGVQISNVATETSTQPISMHKMLTSKDKFIYFGLNKTDKTGVFVLGQLDADKPYATFLSKRFNTTDYSKHVAVSLIVQGPNFYADYIDNGTYTSMRCATLNSPNRSTTGIYQSLWVDGQFPYKNKQLDQLTVTSYPVPSGASVTTSVATDYSASFVAVNKNDNSNMGTNDVIGYLSGNIKTNWKVMSVKVVLGSNGANSPKVTGIGIFGNIKDEIATI